MDPLRLTYLLDRYVDEALTPEEKAELEQTLLGSPAARTLFWEHTGFHALLREEAAQAGGLRMTAAVEQAAAGPGMAMDPGWSFSPPPAPARKVSWLPLGLGLAAAAVVTAGMWQGLRQPETAAARLAPAPEAEATISSIAVVTEMVNARWSGGGRAPALGTNLEAGWLKLDSGMAQLEFVSGARVIVQGPAELQLISPMEAYCRRGRLTAEVPAQAEGFRINTKQFFVVDLGTAFGMNVGEDGAAEVHVFDGEVEVHQAGAMLALTEGRGVAVDPAGAFRETAGLAGSGFPSPSGMDSLAGELRRQRLEAWQQVLASHRQQPGLLRYFSFGENPSARRTLTNLSPVGEADAVIVGAQWTDGRWPGKRALDFRGVNDRVRFAVPGEFTSLTMVASVRTSGAPGRGSSLMMTDSYEAGEVHWQISPRGELQVGIQHPDLTSGIDYKSPVVFTPEVGGQWLRVALVIDGTTKEVQHYVDGRLIGSDTLRSPLPLRIGLAELGNWNRLGRTTMRPVRNYVGMMDEFMLFDHALTEAEISSLCGWNADG